MVKRIDSTGNWWIMDNKRSPTNGRNDILAANLSNAEAAGGSTEFVDFNPTNFQLTNANAEFNASGGTYIYMAFANQF